MINIFELSAGMTNAKMHMEKSRRDESSRRRGRSDSTTKAQDSGLLDDKWVTHESRCSLSKNSCEVSMKMLIEDEMMREHKIWKRSPNVVAKLMGLDASPDRVFDTISQTIQGKSHSFGRATRSHRRKENIYNETMLRRDVQPLGNYISVLRTGRIMNGQQYDEYSRDAMMALVRQKFLEAKHVATDHQLVRSEKFQDFSEAVSSNRDLFHAYLEQRDPLFPCHLHKARRRSLLTRDKCVTVLKPSKKAKDFCCSTNRSLCAHDFVHQKPIQPTRIVVLKPSSRKPIETGDRLPSIRTQGSRKDSGWDEALPSPILSNGYVGDGSTMYLSGEERTDESDFITPMSRHSWDCTDRIDSTCSSSSKRGSHSPESPVIREAKKRLSRRLVRANSNLTNQEQEQARATQRSTLGEVLAISDTRRKVEMRVSTRKSCSGESDLSASSFFHVENEVGSLQRSRSVPSFLSVYENGMLESEAPSSPAAKSTLKGKISSFFSRQGQKSGGEKSPRSSSGRSDRNPSGSNACHGASEGFSSLNTEERAQNSGYFFAEKSENGIDNLHQPSPVSTLDAPFADSDRCNVFQHHEGECRRGISRSTPIESVARTLSLDSLRAKSKPTKHLGELLKADVEEHERVMFIQLLLSSIFVTDDKTPALHNWHSVESPLNRSTLEKFFECEKEVGRCREKRSNHMLLFDCINAVLLETACASTATPLTDEVLHCVREWFSKGRSSLSSSPENVSQMVDRILRKELGGTMWMESALSETAELKGEIEWQVMQELLGEVLDDFITLSPRCR